MTAFSYTSKIPYVGNTRGLFCSYNVLILLHSFQIIFVELKDLELGTVLFSVTFIVKKCISHNNKGMCKGFHIFIKVLK